MKTKKDFVTNSSSMSFIVWGESTSQVARDMLEIIYEDHNKSWPESIEEIPSDVMEWFLNNSKFKDPIVFTRSINYDTFIYKDWLGKIRVDTANNHNWATLDYEYLSEDQEYDVDMEKEFYNPFTDQLMTRETHDKAERAIWDKHFAEEIPCDKCNKAKEDVKLKIDPFEQDVHNKKIYRYLCKDCEDILIREI